MTKRGFHHVTYGLGCGVSRFSVDLPLRETGVSLGGKGMGKMYGGIQLPHEGWSR